MMLVNLNPRCMACRPSCRIFASAGADRSSTSRRCWGGCRWRRSGRLTRRPSTLSMRSRPTCGWSCGPSIRASCQLGSPRRGGHRVRDQRAARRHRFAHAAQHPERRTGCRGDCRHHRASTRRRVQPSRRPADGGVVLRRGGHGSGGAGGPVHGAVPAAPLSAGSPPIRRSPPSPDIELPVSLPQHRFRPGSLNPRLSPVD